jgi:hypothetical protein
MDGRMIEVIADTALNPLIISRTSSRPNRRKSAVWRRPVGASPHSNYSVSSGAPHHMTTSRFHFEDLRRRRLGRSDLYRIRGVAQTRQRRWMQGADSDNRPVISVAPGHYWSVNSFSTLLPIVFTLCIPWHEPSTGVACRLYIWRQKIRWEERRTEFAEWKFVRG